MAVSGDEMALNGRDQMGGLHRLRNIGVHAGLQTTLAIAVHGVGGHRDDGQEVPARLAADQARGFQAVEHGHLDVHQYKVVRGAREAAAISFSSASRPSLATSMR